MIYAARARGVSVPGRALDRVSDTQSGSHRNSSLGTLSMIHSHNNESETH